MSPAATAGCAGDKFLRVLTSRARVWRTTQHARQLGDASVVAELNRFAQRLPIDISLRDRHVSVGKRRHLGKVGHDQHLMGTSEITKILPHRVGDIAADTGIDLVEHEGRRPSGEYSAKRQHGPGEFATRCHPAKRLRLMAGVGCEPDRDLLAGLPRDRDVESRASHGEALKVCLDRLGEPRRSLGAGAQNLGPHTGEICEKGGASGIEFGSPFVEGHKLGEAFGRLLFVNEDVVERFAVLPTQLAKQRSPFAKRLEPDRIVVDSFGAASRFGSDVGDLGCEPLKPDAEVVERRPTIERCKSASDAVGRWTVGVEKRDGLRSRLPVGGGVGKQALFVIETIAFVGVLNSGGFDLGELMTQQIDFSGSDPVVASKLSERSICSAQFIEQRSQKSGVDPAILIERCSLHARLEQRLVGVLAMQIDEVDAVVRQRRHRGEMTVDVDPTSSITRNDTTDDEFIVPDDEAALNLCFGSARSD